MKEEAMKIGVLRLQEAMIHANRQRSARNEEKLDYQAIGAAVFPEVNKSTQKTYISGLKNGTRWSLLSPRVIARLCKALEVSADYLLGISEDVRGGYDE